MDSAEYLHKLSEAPERTRNFCMVAHVDHGKTTLSDFLVASNGLLSQQLAGKVRLLDSRPDEQERMITMKASSIALRHRFEGKDHLLHLVDSPGHIDFSCEVSTAIRLCDGALILVDLVDGVTMQTCSMLRHVYREGLSMCLVLNKVDLLITRQQMTAEEAYLRMRSVIETCNATLAAYANQLKIAGEYEQLHLDDPSDDVWFCPTKGNVVFASCFDGWGFSIRHFAKLYEEKLQMTNLTEALWGEFYLDPKAKGVSTTPKRAGQPVLAIQLILEPIWQLHRAFLETDPLDTAAISTMGGKIGVPDSVWNRPRFDARQKLGAMLSHWLPLAKCVLDMVCQRVFSPIDSHRQRLPAMMPALETLDADTRQQLTMCSSVDNAPGIAFISKLMDSEYLTGQTIGHDAPPLDEALIGFARVHCGRLRKGQHVYVTSDGETNEGTIAKLYLLRGLGLEEVPEVCSGCLCGIGGLTPLITKYATVTTRADIPPFASPTLPSTSIVRLAVSPKDPTQLQQLVRGLHMLNKVDPQVEVTILPTGEHVIGTAGEVHAERCIKDLHDTFAKIEMITSEPLVSFRETIVVSGTKLRPVTVETSDGQVSVTVVARALPVEVLNILKDDSRNNSASQQSLVPKLMHALSECEEKKRWQDVAANGCLAVGPLKFHFTGAMLFTSITDPTTTAGQAFRVLKESIIAGFTLASMAGPMAEEPLFGVGFTLTDIHVANGEATDLTDRGISGQVMVAARDACRRAMEQHGRRLVEPIYSCVVYSAGTTQGKIYAILNRRRAEVLEEVPNEGSDLFYISSHLPAVEAFGLQDELRVATHGAATAQLQMGHWELIEADPYCKPTTKEEIEENGTNVGTQNIAAMLLEKVRRRKGLHRDMIIESAEKQKFSLKGA